MEWGGQYARHSQLRRGRRDRPERGPERGTVSVLGRAPTPELASPQPSVSLRDRRFEFQTNRHTCRRRKPEAGSRMVQRRRATTTLTSSGIRPERRGRYSCRMGLQKRSVRHRPVHRPCGELTASGAPERRRLKNVYVMGHVPDETPDQTSETPDRNPGRTE